MQRPWAFVLLALVTEPWLVGASHLLESSQFLQKLRCPPPQKCRCWCHCPELIYGDPGGPLPLDLGRQPSPPASMLQLTSAHEHHEEQEHPVAALQAAQPTFPEQAACSGPECTVPKGCPPSAPCNCYCRCRDSVPPKSSLR